MERAITQRCFSPVCVVTHEKSRKRLPLLLAALNSRIPRICPRSMRRQSGAGGTMESGMLLDSQSINPIGTPIEVIRGRLEVLPRFPRYADQVDAALALLGSIRPWLSGETGPTLASAAYDHNDAIFQLVDGYSVRFLPNSLRQFSKVPSASDVETIMAFALGCSLRALGALASVLGAIKRTNYRHLRCSACT